jgi:hypothetical protein
MMGIAETKAQSGMDRWSIPAAFFAGACNLLCWIILNHANYVIQIYSRQLDSMVMNYPEMVSECIWLAPLLVVIIFRHILAVTLFYASILSVITAGRIYYFVQFLLIGTDALERKLDWPALLLNLLGAVSLAAVLIWAMMRSAILFRNFVKRDDGAKPNG